MYLCMRYMSIFSIYRALAKNCDCPIDDKKGGSAKDWKKGRPIRVVSNDFYLVFVI